MPIVAVPTTTLADRVCVYDAAARGDEPALRQYPDCGVTSATAADMAITRRRDGAYLRTVLRLAGVSL